MFFVILALVEAGDEAIYPDPGFPIYRSMIDFAGATAVPIPLREERAFGIDVEELASLITPKTKLLILNSPGNPTGGVLNREEIAEIARLAVEHDLIVLADEIYSEMIYEGEHVSIATMPGMAERTIILDGFSKTYAMTGWRLGYGLMPPSAGRGRQPPDGQQRLLHLDGRAAGRARRPDRAAGRGRGDARGVPPPPRPDRRRPEPHPRRSPACPRRARSTSSRTSARLGVTSKQFADLLLDEHGVAALAGTAFGGHGEGYLRLSTANSEANLSRALERIDQAARSFQ